MEDNCKPEAQSNLKRYQVEISFNAALMEDALSKNLGPSTTKLLDAIGLTDKKNKPNGLTGNNNQVNTEKQPGLVTSNIKFKCGQEGQIFGPRTLDLTETDNDSGDNMTVNGPNAQPPKERATKISLDQIKRVLERTGAKTAILPKQQTTTFWQKPMMAAYYALHTMGINDDNRKKYRT